jgi:hypothetical protein
VVKFYFNLITTGGKGIIFLEEEGSRIRAISSAQPGSRLCWTERNNDAERRYGKDE